MSKSIEVPPGPGEPGHHLPTWSAWKQRQYERKFFRFRNACIRAGLLGHMKEVYWPEVEVDGPKALEIDTLAAHDG